MSFKIIAYLNTFSDIFYTQNCISMWNNNRTLTRYYNFFSPALINKCKKTISFYHPNINGCSGTVLTMHSGFSYSAWAMMRRFGKAVFRWKRPISFKKTRVPAPELPSWLSVFLRWISFTVCTHCISKLNIYFNDWLLLTFFTLYRNSLIGVHEMSILSSWRLNSE